MTRGGGARLTRLLCVAGLVLLAPGTATAANGPVAAPAIPCHWSLMANPFVPGRDVGYLHGLVVIADGTEPRTGRVRCSLQYGSVHSDPDLVTVTSPTTPGVAMVGPTPFEYVRGPWEPLPNSCTEVEIDGAGTFYWDDPSGAWSTSPLASCHITRDGDEVLLPDEPFDAYDDLLEAYHAAADPVWADHVDPVVCPVFGSLSPGAGPVTVEPEGDVTVGEDEVWLCPPYEEAP